MATQSRLERVQAVKEDFFSRGPLPGPVDSSLLESWQRSRLALGEPSNIRDVPQVDERMLDTHLLDIFQAPLSRVSDDLDGSGMALLLADAEGRILQRWSHERAAVEYLDRLGTVRGAVLAERTVGTNGVGTVASTGKSVQVFGTEHFADFYSRAVCTGSPVRHPLTGKLLAVVTVSSEISERSGLLIPLVNSVTRHLEQQLLETESPQARAMFNAFILASRNQAGPVIAFGPQGLVMQSQRAGRLTAGDVTSIQQLCAERRRTGRYLLELSAGTVELQVTQLESGAGTLVVLDRQRRSSASSIGPARSQLVGRTPEWLSAVHQIARHRESRRPVVVTGEAGSGKTSLALGLPFTPGTGAGSIVVDAAERHVLGSRKWLQKLADRLSAATPVIVRGVETLDQPTVDGVRSLIESVPGRGPVLLTMSVSSQSLSEPLAQRLGLPTIWVPPLRERVSDIELLWNHFSEQLAPGAGLDPRKDTVPVLTSYRWPGNVKELRSAVERLVIAGHRGPVAPGDLPRAMQGGRQLSMIEQVELEAIRRALHDADGNRSKAAELLGLSRATVYRKMKAYRLSA